MSRRFSKKIPRSVVVACLVLAAGYFMVMQHWQHIAEFLPYLILMICPLMHLFMHQGHGSRAQGNDEEPDAAYWRGVEDGKKGISKSQDCH